MTLADIIKQYRKVHNLSTRAFAERVGCTNAYISLLENDKIKSPSITTVKNVATAMNMELDGLLVMMDNMKISLKDDDAVMYQSSGIDFIRIPLYSPISCGTGAFVEDEIIEYVPVPSKGLSDPENYFCQIADGDSMRDAGIASGDLLVFEKMEVVDSGTIGCFCVDDNIATCKKYIRSGDMIMLQPMNSAYQPIIIDPLYSRFKCLGKLKKAIKDFERE